MVEKAVDAKVVVGVVEVMVFSSEEEVAVTEEVVAKVLEVVADVVHVVNRGVGKIFRWGCSIAHHPRTLLSRACA